MVVPATNSMLPGNGSYAVNDETGIAAPDGLLPVARWLQCTLRPVTGLRLPFKREAKGIRLAVNDALGAEAYRVHADGSGVQITGGDAAGVFYGCQTLLQLLPPKVFRSSRVTGVVWTVPAVDISDSPRFGWRGAMLDVSRHFLPKREVLRFIDLLAMHRMNRLHLHLTDDQGWRMEIKRYPRLTSVGSWRTGSQVGVHGPLDARPHGGYYTQDDLREIVAYAADRFITVMPEIEMPGHIQAAIAAYPELGVSGEELPVLTDWGICENVLNAETATLDFLRGVLDEVLDVFPSEFICVGGDECPTVQWAADERSQQLMRERGIAGEHDLQAWFMAQIGVYLTEQGRRMVGWDEILEGPVPAGAIVASWRGTAGAVTAARKGHDVVSCPDDRVYLDYRQSDRDDEPIPVAIPLTLRRVYEFDPVPDDLTPDEAAHVLGGQANIWTEHMDSPRMVDYFAFPRLCAIAEALWRTGPGNYSDFSARLDEHLARLDALGVEYRHQDGPLPWQTRPGVPGRPASIEQRAEVMDALVADIRD